MARHRAPDARLGGRASTPGELIRALQAEFERLMEQRETRVVVLAGSGNRIFCAGHDLAEFQEREDPAFHECVARECSAMTQTMRQLPQIVIARVDGIATAAGCQLVAAADLALASGKAGFWTQLGMTEPQAYDFVCGQVREHIAHPDAKEGIGAFLEKRVPVWGQPPGQ